ncbi:Prion-like-(Q/N-rich)-domain-bearing protein [Caenorhabditis elegans]|uniref:Prion-like-(Q/N-rich)-domain-bearing protein n=1 Tax=Caenorhabditis elegans TaxID=6239 RepID=A9D602_CAEEL|nr:Prion-like-(Q/N-rich)-domain-bearing protein [Caenorhabditis elegans]CCD71699.1 Prion-like-(Q/N-rich)-domain-bearing protein [Caenorhabditis elegans]|eukprot:NP_494278.3 Prion-like-(Q/N-rich)-domain-bearing protein [Caenorhabditis elegans]
MLLILLLIPQLFALSPLQPCSQSPSITFRGANDVTRAGGTPALFVFAPLQCANCYNFLRRLNDLAASRAYRIHVVAPDFESNHIIQRTSSAFPNLQIDRAGEGWPRLGAQNFDAFVLDGCSRVTDTYQWPQSDVVTSPDIQNALNSATSSKCNNGGARCQMTSPAAASKKRVNAWLKEQQEAAAEQQRRAQTQMPRHQQQYQAPQQQQQNYHQNSQNPYQQPNYQQNQYQPQLQQFQQNPRQQQHVYSNPQQGYQQNYQNLYTPPPAQQAPIPTEKVTTTTTATDYDYYPNENEDAAVTTTPSTQTQIPRPPSHGSAWPTFPPHQQWTPQGYPYGYQQNPNSPPNPALMMDANLPCSAFTDDICHQQREQMGSLVSKCCNKGIYLTDVCIPGKCSNSTTQLCCFQKFLQAKYSCCNDPTQDEGAPKLTNKFNKCCHNLFVTDDACCPQAAARRYWSTAYEVCMPTVTVDFSPVRFEVHFTEGVRVLDLSVDRQWEFNCTYGDKQPQFAYLPVDVPTVKPTPVRGL